MTSRSRVDVVADSGIPTRLVSKLVADDNFTFDITQRQRQIPLHADGVLDLTEVKQWARDDEAHYLIVVTEIPRRLGRKPKMSEIFPAEGIAIISVPALGVLLLEKKLRAVIATTIGTLQAGKIRNEPRALGVIHTGESTVLTSRWWWPGRSTLVCGMVAMNEPLKTLPKLTGALAAAAATGAFGIFYSSIWQMADALPLWRLILISLSVILVMVFWLCVSNGLWEKGPHYGSKTESVMYNASTAVTLLMSVTLLYIVLFAGILLTSLIVIEGGFLASVLGHESSFGDYLNIAWLSASLGTVAGSLGSNFDDTNLIRHLTHGRREAFRMEQHDDEG